MAPMRSELRPVVRAMGGRPEQLGELQAFVGTAGDNSVTATMIGVGPDAARRCADHLLDAASFDHVVVTGIAGGIGPGVAVGDLVTPEAVEDLRSGTRYTPRTLGRHRPAGTVGTTHELIVDDERIAELVRRGVVALDMETSAVAAVCEKRAVPWSVFRVVSDRPEDGLLDHGVFELLEADGTVHPGRTIKYVVTRPSRVRHLARLARDAGGAARKAALATLSACATL
jgi:nucleoside phosphorylase